MIKPKIEQNLLSNNFIKAMCCSTLLMAGPDGNCLTKDKQSKPASKENRTVIEEVYVTATKRNTSLQDTAMAISALDELAIERRGLTGMDDYLRTLPGVSMQDRGASQNSIVMRGLSADPQEDSSTTGIYFGEALISDLFSASNLGSAGNGDIKLVDIERIEVLRGPQGTLYGSGSMAGTLRIIPNSPNAQHVEGKLALRYSQTAHEGDDNAMIQAVINIPVVENQLAVRAVAYQYENSGYIKNVAASQPVAGIATTTALGGVARDSDDIGNDSYTGFRVAALWHATSNLDVTVSYLQQDIEQEGTPEVNLDLAGQYQQRRINTGPQGSRYEFLENDIDITSLLVEYDFEWGNLTSASSWMGYQSALQTDLSHITVFFGLPNQPFYSDGASETDLFTEELRFSSKLDGAIQFIVAIYYEDRELKQSSPWLWGGEPAQEPSFQLSDVDVTVDTEQKALFGEISYDISDQLTVTLGGRHFDYDSGEDRTLSFFGIPSVTKTAIEESGQTYKVNLSYVPNESTLVYGEWAEGFRLGSGQAESANCIVEGFPTPSQVDSDTSENIELGVKTSVADDRVTLNTALYHVDWEGIPVTVNPAGACVYIANAGKAKSQGIELELRARLTDSLQVDLSASYGESTLEENSSIGSKGDNLPGSADVNASMGIEYLFTLAGYDSFARLDYLYVGEHYNSVNEDEAGSLPAGDFSQVNIKLGVDFSQVAVDLFVNNVTDDNGLTWVDSVNGAIGVNRATRIRPRTVGLNVNYQF